MTLSSSNHYLILSAMLHQDLLLHNDQMEMLQANAFTSGMDNGWLMEAIKLFSSF